MTGARDADAHYLRVTDDHSILRNYSNEYQKLEEEQQEEIIKEDAFLDRANTLVLSTFAAIWRARLKV